MQEEQREGGQKKGWGILKRWRGESAEAPKTSAPQAPEGAKRENIIEAGETVRLSEPTHLRAPGNELYLVNSSIFEREGTGVKKVPVMHVVTADGTVNTKKFSGDQQKGKRGPGFFMLPERDGSITVINNTPLEFERDEFDKLPFGERTAIAKGALAGFQLPPEPLSLGLSPNVEVTLDISNGVPALFYGGQIAYLEHVGNGVYRATVGRQPETNSLVVPSPTVSRDHGEIIVIQGEQQQYVFVRDKDSRNGMDVTRAPMQELAEGDIRHGREYSIAVWESSRTVPLQESDELRQIPYKAKQQGKVKYYYPESTSETLVSRVFAISTALDRQLQMPEDSRYLPTIEMVRVPRKHARKSAAKGTDIILNTDNVTAAAHELTHGKLSAKYGQSASLTAVEGMAVYMTYQVVPEAPQNDMDFELGFIEVVDLNRNGIPVGFSHTEMLSGANRDVPDKERYDYSYRFGRYFIDYLDTTYGRDFVLRFYEGTCGMVRDETGRLLCNGGRLEAGVKERELNEYALRRAAKVIGVSYTSEEFRQNFDNFIKGKTEEAQMAPLRKWFANVFGT